MRPARGLLTMRLLAALLVAVVSGSGLMADNEQSRLWHVESVDASSRTWQIRAPDSQDILSVQVAPGDAAIDYTGRIIKARLVESALSQRLESIWPADPMQVRLWENANRQLRRDTVTRGRQVYRGMGEYIPPFALFNQQADLVRPQNWRGEYVVLNFVFTRCRIDEMCPAATRRMAKLQKEMNEAGMEHVRLATISFDPEHDTPGILNYYASTRDIDFSNYDFLTGTPEAINDLMRQFGIITVNEDDTIDHTMATILISPTGQIIYRREGSRWNSQDFIQRILAHQAS